MKKIIYTLTAATAVALAGCSAPAAEPPPAPAPTVTVTSPAPEPVAPEPVEEEYSAAYLALEIAWKDQSRSSREDMCVAYALMPGSMWRAFNEGTDGGLPLTKSEFYQFMDDHC